MEQTHHSISVLNTEKLLKDVDFPVMIQFKTFNPIQDFCKGINLDLIQFMFNQ